LAQSKTVTATINGVGVTQTAAVVVNPAAAAKLAFTVQPTSAVAGAGITPSVQVTALDANDNTATGFTGNITVAIGTNPGGGALTGTATVAATAGVASFANLSINKVGTGYTLMASSGSLTVGTSAAFQHHAWERHGARLQRPAHERGGGGGDHAGGPGHGPGR